MQCGILIGQRSSGKTDCGGKERDKSVAWIITQSSKLARNTESNAFVDVRLTAFISALEQYGEEFSLGI